MINSCWIAPNGDIYKVKSHGHAEFARKILNIQNLGVNEAIFQLTKQGWLHIGPAPFVSVIPYKELSENQYKTIHKLVNEVVSGIIRENILSYIYT